MSKQREGLKEVSEAFYSTTNYSTIRLEYRKQINKSVMKFNTHHSNRRPSSAYFHLITEICRTDCEKSDSVVLIMYKTYSMIKHIRNVIVLTVFKYYIDT